MPTPTRLPSAFTRCTVRCRLWLPSQWTRNESEPASVNSFRKQSGSEIIRWISKGNRVTRRSDATIGTPHRKIGHKVAIHHVDVNPIGSRPFGLSDLLAQAGKVSREDGRGNFDDALVHITICSRA